MIFRHPFRGPPTRSLILFLRSMGCCRKTSVPSRPLTPSDQPSRLRSPGTPKIASAVAVTGLTPVAPHVYGNPVEVRPRLGTPGPTYQHKKTCHWECADGGPAEAGVSEAPWSSGPSIRKFCWEGGGVRKFRSSTVVQLLTIVSSPGYPKRNENPLLFTLVVIFRLPCSQFTKRDQ